MSPLSEELNGLGVAFKTINSKYFLWIRHCKVLRPSEKTDSLQFKQTLSIRIH